MITRLRTVAGLVALLLAVAAPLLAADVAEVVDALGDGVYVEDGSSASEAEIGAAVGTVRNAGERLSIVVLSEEPVSGAAVFAESVADEGVRGIVLVIAPESVGFAGTADVFTGDELNAATQAALDDGGDDAELAQAFAAALTGVTVPNGAAADDGGGGGGSGLLWLVVIVAAGGLFVWWLSRRARAKASEESESRLAKARAGIQEQIDAVANDILELEDEVRVADDPRADRFFEEASATYRKAGDAFAEAKTPEQLMAIANDLDEAIWQLDCAEAVLDGNPLPDRPERRRLEPPPRSRSEASRRPAPPPRPPEYPRRPTRRSSYGGSSMMDLITVLGASVLSGRGRRGGGLFGGAAGRRPSSGSRARPAPTPRRRGTGGKRVRGGGRRRR